MKNRKTIPQTLLFLAVIFIAAQSDAFARKPFVIKLVEKPAVLSVGQTYTFVFDVQNVSGAPLTLSSQYAASATLFWFNKDGTGGGTGSGCESSTVVISTDYDPVTGKFTCVSETLPYSRSSFFTL